MKYSRRNFLSTVPLAAIGLGAATRGILGNGSAGADSPAGGRQYEAEVPDTLDLADRGKFALNGLAGTLDWEHAPEFYFRVTLEPPAFIHDALSFCACGPKYWESFPMLRVMSGSDLYADIEKRYTDYMLSSIEEDGLFYAKIGPERPWDHTSPEDYANIYGQGRMIRALLAHYYYDGNPDWMKRADKIAKRLAEIGIYKDDYVYYPTTPGYGDIFSYPKSGWKVKELLRGAQQTMADFPDDTMGIPMYLGGTILPLVRCYEATRDERTLELAGKLTRFLLKPDSAWMPGSYARGVTPSEHGEYRGHFHGHVMALRGILAYGVAANDTGIKNFARDGYEFSRNLGIARLGWFEEYAGKHSHETCCLADMVPLAIRLSEAGLGDYWDDVDGYARNHLVEGQFVDLERLKQLNKELTPEGEKLLERSLGTYAGWGTPVAISTVLQNCCMANGSQALYAVWDSIVKYENGTTRVNLLLNRASPWADVDSYLPHEGKVVIQNKQAKRLLVRIAGWVDQRNVRCDVQGSSAAPLLIGNYLVLDPIAAPATVTLTFRIREDTQSFSFQDYGDRGRAPQSLGTYKYEVTFRAGTAIKVVSIEGTPRQTYDGGKRNAVPTYTAYQDRAQLGNAVAPIKKVERYAVGTVIPSW